MDYSVSITDDNPLGISFIQSGEWAIVTELTRENCTVKIGSALVMINGDTCTSSLALLTVPCSLICSLFLQGHLVV